MASLVEGARGKPGAVSRRMSPGNHLRWLPTLAGEIIKPGGTNGIPFGGYATRGEAINVAKDLREACRDVIAQANGEG